MALPTTEPTAPHGEDAHAEPSGNQLRARLDAARQELAEFRQRVRDRAIRGFHDHDWTLDSLNASLGRLGLDPYEPAYLSRTTVRIDLPVDMDGNRDSVHDRLTRLETQAVSGTLADTISSVLTQHEPAVRTAGTATVSIGLVTDELAD